MLKNIFVFLEMFSNKEKEYGQRFGSHRREQKYFFVLDLNSSVVTIINLIWQCVLLKVILKT